MFWRSGLWTFENVLIIGVIALTARFLFATAINALDGKGAAASVNAY